MEPHATAPKDATADDFDRLVIERSHRIPVLVDFWAPWCGPCRALAPTLERLAQAYAGAMELVKLNTEDEPQIAQRFGIRGIPNLKLFVNGQVAGEVTGALPERDLRRFLDQHLPSEADEAVARARAALAAGDVDGARRELEAAVAARPGHGPARLELAKMAVADGDAAALAEHARAVDPMAPEADRIHKLEGLLELRAVCEQAGGLAATVAEVAPEPAAAEPWYRHGACLAVDGDYEGALAAFMRAIEAAAPRAANTPQHRAMLTVFGLLGPHHPAAEPYKRKLQIYV